MMRHIAKATPPARLQEEIAADLDRATRLLDTGLWSFNLMVDGHRTKEQLREAALAAEAARQQVMKALRDAKQAFRSAREQGKAHQREHREEVREAQRKHRDTVREQGRRLRGKGR
jgi:outer membrane protein TolC